LVELEGEFKIKIIQDSELREIHSCPNLVTNVGLRKLLNYLLDVVTPGLQYIAVGSDSTTPSSGDTALGSEIDRKSVMDRKLVNTAVRFSTWFGSAEANGTWREIGLFDKSVGGTLFCRSLIDPPIEKTADKVIYVEYEVSAGG